MDIKFQTIVSCGPQLYPMRQNIKSGVGEEFPHVVVRYEEEFSWNILRLINWLLGGNAFDGERSLKIKHYLLNEYIGEFISKYNIFWGGPLWEYGLLDTWICRLSFPSTLLSWQKGRYFLPWLSPLRDATV